MTTYSDVHIHHMQSALNLARLGLGRTAPNPSVGCVIVREGHIVGRGRTAQGGRPHAESQALEMAGVKAKGATVYVTLEPCSHQGKTPPCAQNLIKAGVKKVYVAIKDTDKRVSGRGIEMLKAAGIEVDVGLLEQQAYEINKGFFLTHSHNRPLITLKIATTLDGKIAGADKKQVRITNALSHARAHLLRAQHDAIAVGVNTVLIDNPQLTTRLNGVDHLSKIVVFDRNKRLTGNEKIFEHDPIIVTEDNLETAMADLCQQGVTRLMVEGGAGIISRFIQEGLYDQFYWFCAPHKMGEGLEAISHFDIHTLESHTDLALSSVIPLNGDILKIYKK